MLYKSGDSLLTQFPELQIVINPYTRFYLYRRYPKEVVPDIDSSDNMKEIYKFLKWYDGNVDHDYLEPDTFFASAHNILKSIVLIDILTMTKCLTWMPKNIESNG